MSVRFGRIATINRYKSGTFSAIFNGDFISNELVIRRGVNAIEMCSHSFFINTKLSTIGGKVSGLLKTRRTVLCLVDHVPRTDEYRNETNCYKSMSDRNFIS